MAEALSVVGLVGSIITIIDTTTDIYKLAQDAEKLPEAFAAVNERLPILRETFSVIDESYHGSEDGQAIQQALIACKSKVEDLSHIFGVVCSAEGDSVLQRYRKALRSLKPGRREKVETLFRGILDTLLALQAFHVFKHLLPVEDLTVAMQEMDDVEPSMADGISTTIHSSGTGAMFNNGMGEFKVTQQIGNGGYQAGTMNFNSPPGTRFQFTFTGIFTHGIVQQVLAVDSLVKVMQHPFHESMRIGREPWTNWVAV